MSKKRKPVHYNHKKKRQSKFTKKVSAFIKKVKRNKRKTLAVVIAVFVILLMIYSHLTNPVRISDENYIHNDKFEDCVVVDGIDVSYAQGSDINWSKVKSSGIDFVFIRGGFTSASNGEMNTDEMFESNINGAANAGLMVGVYYYSQAVTSKEAEAEANYLLNIVKPYNIDMPLVIDYETFTGGRLANAISAGSVTSDDATTICITFCDKINSAGYESMVYGNYSFLNNNQDISRLSGNTNIWLAHYAYSTDFAYNYSYWQCSATSSVEGITGNVDKNFWYFNPDGTAYNNASSYDVTKKSLSSCNVTLNDHSLNYIGFNVEPGVTVYDGKTKLKENTDYTVSYIKNTSEGTGYAIVTGTGDYNGRLTSSFKIKKLL